MAIFEYEENGQRLWRFYLNLRSTVNPRIRLQRRGSGYRSEKEAKDEERRQLLQMTSEIAKLETVGSTWGDVIDRWEAVQELYPTKKYVPTTVKDHVSLLKKWTKHWLHRVASDLNRGDGRALLSQVEQLEKTKGFQKRLKNTINVVYMWGIDEGIIAKAKFSPLYGLDIDYKREEKLPEILTLEQMQKLLREAKYRMHPWYPIWAVTILTGVRNGEAFGLRREDIELVSNEEAAKQLSLLEEKRYYGKILLTRAWNSRLKRYGPLKARYWRTIPVSSQLHALINELMAQDFGSDDHGRYLLPRFPEWRDGEQAQVLRMFCKEIGIPSIRFHTLRACFATHLISMGVPSAALMKVGGWRDLKTMERYVRLAGIDERGVTEKLKVLSTELGVMEEVTNLCDFRANRARPSS